MWIAFKFAYMLTRYHSNRNSPHEIDPSDIRSFLSNNYQHNHFDNNELTFSYIVNITFIPRKSLSKIPNKCTSPIVKTLLKLGFMFIYLYNASANSFKRNNRFNLKCISFSLDLHNIMEEIHEFSPIHV